MSKTLRLMDETDLPQVSAAFAKALAPRSTVCGINWQHDDERPILLLVETDVPAAEIGEVYRKSVMPLLGRLEGEFGEFSFEMRALCACGAVATPMILDNPEYSMCLCGECLGREIDEHRDGPPHTCPICEKGFDGCENPGWRVNCSAKLESQADGAEPEMDIGTIRIKGGAPDMSRWNCCSRECALEQFRLWLSEVESHPVAKEAGS